MKLTGPMKPGEIREVNKREHQFNLVIMILRNELQKRADCMRDRLAATQHGWRDLKLLMYLVDHIQDAITKTIPDKDVQRYLTYAQHGRLTIDMPSAVELPSHVVIEKHDLNELANWAIYGSCVTCMREGKEIRKCPLRQILMSIAPPDHLNDHNRIMSCEYIELAQMIVLDPDGEQH